MSNYNIVKEVKVITDRIIDFIAMNQFSWKKLHENKNVHAVLKTIILCEHGKVTDDVFYTLFGGEKVADLSKHPEKVITKGGYSSSAFGAFQILKKTNNELIEKYKMSPSYYPKEQIKKGLKLIEIRGAMGDIIAGNWENVMKKLAPEWASIPYPPKGYKSYYGQPSKGRDYFVNNIEKFKND